MPYLLVVLDFNILHYKTKLYIVYRYIDLAAEELHRILRFYVTYL